MQNVSLKTVYNELKSLKREIEIVKYAVIPEEKLSEKELKSIRKTQKEMESGKEKSFVEVFRN
jgi:hypothetical protein